MKNHQTRPGIVEKGIQEANSTRIKLLGPQSLLSEVKYSNLNLKDAQDIASKHDVGSLLFYTLERHTENLVVGVEKGIGRLEKEGDSYYINRLVAIFRGKRPDSLKLATKIADFETARDTYLVIGTSAPSTIQEMLFLPHCIVSSNERGIQTTPIPENSLVGRLEGDIEALNYTELAELLGNVSPKLITLAPSGRPENPKEGTIIFNETTRVFEKYDRNGWGQF